MPVGVFFSAITDRSSWMNVAMPQRRNTLQQEIVEFISLTNLIIKLHKRGRRCAQSDSQKEYHVARVAPTRATARGIPDLGGPGHNIVFSHNSRTEARYLLRRKRGFFDGTRRFSFPGIINVRESVRSGKGNFPIPLKCIDVMGYKCVNGRPTKVQQSNRPGSMWPEISYN